jgi:hypothetical protein
MHPQDAEIGNGTDPFQLTVTSETADIWVVLLTGSGQPPMARIVGEGLRSGIEVQNIQVFLDPSDDHTVLRTR